MQRDYRDHRLRDTYTQEKGWSLPHRPHSATPLHLQRSARQFILRYTNIIREDPVRLRILGHDPLLGTPILLYLWSATHLSSMICSQQETGTNRRLNLNRLENIRNLFSHARKINGYSKLYTFLMSYSEVGIDKSTKNQQTEICASFVLKKSETIVGKQQLQA